MKQPFCKGRVYHGHSWIDVRCRKRSTKDGFCSQHHPQVVARRAMKYALSEEVGLLMGNLATLPKIGA